MQTCPTQALLALQEELQTTTMGTTSSVTTLLAQFGRHFEHLTEIICLTSVQLHQARIQDALAARGFRPVGNHMRSQYRSRQLRQHRASVGQRIPGR